MTEIGQPIGEPLPHWISPPAVEPVTLNGRYCRVEPLAESHFAPLYEELVLGSPDSIWTYLSAFPFSDERQFREWLLDKLADPEAVPHAVCDPSGRALGVASYLRLDAANGSVEIGGITWSAALRRTRVATQAMYLFARHVFDDLGYRRYEWKCDSLNEPSRRAAERLGFAYEGTFRNAVVYKSRSRDTAWFSITDAEWPARRRSQEQWLAPENFDADGNQREPLRR